MNKCRVPLWPPWAGNMNYMRPEMTPSDYRGSQISKWSKFTF